MILATMVRTDETALICDLAETYGVLDWKALPLRLAAALSSGLRDDSRIKLKISGRNITSDIALLATAVDRLSFLAWAKTKDAENNRNRPESILKMLLEAGKETTRDYEVYSSPEEFEAARKRALEGK
jgi:hypothetical protein